jgi:predicted O-methyltransferase YrrM
LPSAAAWAYTDTWLEDSEIIRTARSKADELGCASVTPSVGALLTVLAASLKAGTVVEVGTGTGVSASALLAGMTDDGVLTSIDTEAENQRVARDTLSALEYDHVRTRLITGRPLEVLSRLTDHAYDVVFVNADATEYPAILHQAERLLRPGGMVIFAGVQPQTDGAGRDPETTAVHDVITSVRDADHWMPVLLAQGSGVLVALLRD